MVCLSPSQREAADISRRLSSLLCNWCGISAAELLSLASYNFRDDENYKYSLVLFPLHSSSTARHHWGLFGKELTFRAMLHLETRLLCRKVNPEVKTEADCLEPAQSSAEAASTLGGRIWQPCRIGRQCCLGNMLGNSLYM